MPASAIVDQALACLDPGGAVGGRLRSRWCAATFRRRRRAIDSRDARSLLSESGVTETAQKSAQQVVRARGRGRLPKWASWLIESQQGPNRR